MLNQQSVLKIQPRSVRRFPSAPVGRRPAGLIRRAAAKEPAVESIQGVRQDVIDSISKARTSYLLTDTNLDLPNKRKGKVRDTYDLGDKIVVVTTDRQSAFDRLLASVPFKGQVLNQTSSWWFNASRHLVPNALLATPDPNVSIMQKCAVFPVEVVCRGFLTGSTSTSLWTHYRAGAREYCGNAFPNGMVKNQRLSHNVLTPTTKSDEHDVPISPAEIIRQGLMTQEEWDTVGTYALNLFAFGQREAAARGLLLVDTKYEFGRGADGKIYIIDEVHTPDSSRYWLADSYESRLAAGQEPQNIDKEFLRLWFRSVCDPYKDEVLPEAPASLVNELSKRYVHLYERITGGEFQTPDLSKPIEERVRENVHKYLSQNK